ANSILFHPALREQFQVFFHRPDTFTLGVCNGCQMLSHLGGLLPNAVQWPRFERNDSEQFEARLSLVKLEATPSIFFRDMEGCILPVAVAHGEGRVEYTQTSDEVSRTLGGATPKSWVAMRYVDAQGQATRSYPANPNGSTAGIAGLTSADGRVTMMMPHPERVFLNTQLSWKPQDWTQTYSPWMRMFRNARAWLGER
ncbi:MAG: phosphoribosylformylglycinamidine synthase subunit PurQ, partial [Myxococcota bacterium]